MRISKQEYLTALKIVNQFDYEQFHKDDCVICSKPTKFNSYYTSKPLCSQKCLSEWDEIVHDNFKNNTDDFYI